MTDVSEKSPILQRFRIPALLGMAVACALAGYFLSSQFFMPSPRNHEGFSAPAVESTPATLTQAAEADPNFSDVPADLSASGMGDFPNGDPPSNSSLADSAQLPSSVPSPSPSPSDLTSTPADDFAAHLTVADGHLRSGNIVAAHRIYSMLRDGLPGRIPAAILFRLALAAEAFGDFSTALGHYESLLNQRAAPRWLGVAMLGRARCLDSLGRVDLLSRDFLPVVAVDDSLANTATRTELMHLLGRSMLPAVRHPGAQQLLQDDAVSIPDFRVDTNEVLDSLPTDLVAPPSATMAPSLAIIQALSPNAETIFLQAHIPDSQVGWVLGEIGQRCGLKLTLTSAARVLASDHSATIHTDDKSLALLLDGLTLPYGLLWEQTGSGIVVSSRAEAGAERARIALAAAAERIQRTALLESPDSPQAPFTRLALGGLLFSQQKYPDAAHMFALTLDTGNRIRVRSETAFNLGKCQLLLKQPALALDSFLLGVDASTGSPDVRLASHLYAARMHVLMGNDDRAVALLRRALSMAADRDIEPTVALQLSSSYLLAGMPQGANEVLMARRVLFGKRSDRAAAAFLSALARFRAALMEDRRIREARTVVSALGTFDADQQFGEHWHVLAAQACSEIGLTAAANSHWKAALQRLDSVPLRAYVISQLAEVHRTDHQFDSARQLLRLAPADAGDTMSQTILLQSARLALQQNNAEEAVSQCKQVLRNAADPDVKTRAMKLLGTAYQQMGNHQAAVYCFAGMLKEAVASEKDNAEMTISGVAE